MNNLPKKIAIFPLSNAIFFPKTQLPLNIFEDRYIQLVSDQMKNDRLFGMIQPIDKNEKKPKVYGVGCLGKITSFHETSDKRFLINLNGIIRFRILEELNTNKLYREFTVDYSDFSNDLGENNINKKKINNEKIIEKIKSFLKKNNYSIDYNNLKKMDFDQMLNTVCMILPFSPEEKQKLIETIKIEDRVKMLEEIINFNLVGSLQNNTIQ